METSQIDNPDVVATEFVFNIPDGLKPEHAAPMLCAGITVYSPLVRNGTGPGKLVGIIGLGGLGREYQDFRLLGDGGSLTEDRWLSLQTSLFSQSSAFTDVHKWIANMFAYNRFAKALGAKVIVFGHSPSKAPDAIRLGADEYISTADSGFGDKFGAGKGPEFDFILSCADVNKVPMGDFLGCV